MAKGWPERRSTLPFVNEIKTTKISIKINKPIVLLIRRIFRQDDDASMRTNTGIKKFK